MSFINNQNPYRSQTTTPAELNPYAIDDEPTTDSPAFTMKPSQVFGALFGNPDP